MMDWAHVLVIVQCHTDGCSLSCKDGAVVWQSFGQLAAGCLTILEMAVDDRPCPIELSVVGMILKELEPEKNELEQTIRENISFAQYDRQRLQSYFLSKEQSATVKTRQHPSTGPFSSYEFDKEGFICAINNLKPGDEINWRA